jgi:hypothetical protein
MARIRAIGNKEVTGRPCSKFDTTDTSEHLVECLYGSHKNEPVHPALTTLNLRQEVFQNAVFRTTQEFFCEER